MNRNRRSALPDEMETDLLRASLLDGEAALAAYFSWRKKLNIDALDFGSQRVLPLLCKNLEAHGIDDPLMGRFRGVARYAWFLNQTLTAATAPLLKEFKQAHVPVVLLKGMALVSSLPSQKALRAMQDVDLLVRPSDAAAAIDLLMANGWRFHDGTTANFIKLEEVRRTSGYGLEAGRNRELDLHWFLLDQNRWLDADAMLWSRVMPVKFGEELTYAPSFEDQLLHACVHGATLNWFGTLRWATDSIIILRARQAIFDWSYFLDQCRQRRVIIQIRRCLEYLRQFLEAPIPSAVFAELRKGPVSLIDVVDYRYRARIYPSGRPTWVARLLNFQDFRATSKNLTQSSAPKAFVAWLKERWVVDSAWLALVLTLFAKLGQPSWGRILAQRVWRGDWRSVTLRRRKLAKISQGPIDLSLEGDPQNTLLYGWYSPEAQGRWTLGPEAALALDLGSRRQSLRVTMTFFCMVCPSVPARQVKIWANRHKVADWHLTSTAASMHERSFYIPQSVLGGRFLVLTFVIHSPQSPKSLGVSEDCRTRGLFVRALGFEEAASAGNHVRAFV